MDLKIITGALTASGALAYCVWGFVEAYNKTKTTPEVEKFSWIKAAMTVVPSVVAGFLAGYAMDGASTVEFVALVTSGFGIAAAQSKLGINNYFDA